MDNIKKLQLIFQTLSDYNRLGIIRFICDKETSVGEIVKATKLSQPLVSHHLRVLKENCIVETKRKGAFIFYCIRDKKILEAINLFLELAEQTEFRDIPVSKFCPDWATKNFTNKL